MTPLLSDNAPRASSRSATRAQYAYNMHNTPLLSLENGQAFTQNTPVCYTETDVGLREHALTPAPASIQSARKHSVKKQGW